MKTMFELFLSASFFGSVMILLVVAARFALRKAPRRIFCLLWVLVGLRLLIPFRIESDLSLQPSFESVTPAPTVAVQSQQTPAPVPAIPDDVAAPDVLPGDVVVNYDNDAVSAPEQRQIDYMEVTAWVWAVGVVTMAGYTVVTYMLLKRKLKNAVAVEEDVYESDAIDSPFLLGYVKPAVYLPKDISDEDRPYILAHERCHMDRFDNWFKLAGFLCVGLHWFNPLVWLGYHLLCQDIEMACDEAVVRHMDLSSRKGYSAALVSCSTERKFGACPVAFGEVSVKQRVLSVLNYRKPGFWISLACVAVIGFTVVCFMTCPAKDPMDDTLSTNPAELPTEADQITQLCKDALEAYGSDKIYHIKVNVNYESKSGVMDYSTEMEYFCHGENWCQNGTVFEENFTRSTYFVRYEGSEHGSVVMPIVEYDDLTLEAARVWNLNWDKLTYLDTQAAAGSRGYRFLLDGDEENVITFCFNAQGKLTSLQHAFLLVTEMDTISHVSVNCQLLPTDSAAILQTIKERFYGDAGEGVATQDPLQLCKNTINAIQNADSYHYAVQFQTSDPASLLATSMEYFWYSDGNYLAYDSTRDWENQYLIVDGKYFRRDVTIAVPPEDIPYPNWTEVVPDGRNFLGKPWLMELDWDASQPELVASTEENGQRIATFSMVDPEVGNGYMLTFVFDLNSGSVISIQRTTSFVRDGCTYTSTSLVFGIQLNQPQIGERIQQTYLETQLQVIE